MANILSHCYSSPYGGHCGANQTIAKVLQSRFYWPSLFKNSRAYVQPVIDVKEQETSQKDIKIL